MELLFRQLSYGLELYLGAAVKRAIMIYSFMKIISKPPFALSHGGITFCCAKELSDSSTRCRPSDSNRLGWGERRCSGGRFSRGCLR